MRIAQISQRLIFTQFCDLTAENQIVYSNIYLTFSCLLDGETSKAVVINALLSVA